MMSEHQAVLLSEAIDGLAIQENGKYIDATFGRGGHSTEILKKLSSKGAVLAIDQDPAAIAHGQQLAADPRFNLQHASFQDMGQIVQSLGWQQQVDGILLDLGVSSPQLDTAERGFSFRLEGPLDMRMDPTQGISAAQWIAQAKESEIADVLYEYGDERYSRRIARAIVGSRAEQTIMTTTQLAEIVKRAHPRWQRRIHPATRSFQAIRIFINRELEQLSTALNAALNILAPQGRLVVISFHSLEDRIVKRFMRSAEKEHKGLFKRVGKMIKASEEELASNPRARSAVLRIGEKLA